MFVSTCLCPHVCVHMFVSTCLCPHVCVHMFAQVKLSFWNKKYCEMNNLSCLGVFDNCTRRARDNKRVLVLAVATAEERSAGAL